MSMRGQDIAQEISHFSRAGEDEFRAKSERVMRSISQHTPILQDEVERLDAEVKALGLEVRDTRFFANLPWRERIAPAIIAGLVLLMLGRMSTLWFP